jgi:hypothetical protein
LKKYLLVAVLILSISTISFGVDYWYLDVALTESSTGRKTGVVQRAYFFMDLAALESVTGFPRNEYSINLGYWNWRELTFSPYSHNATIYSVMLRDGFKAAFILDNSGTSKAGRPYYNYSVFFISNGRLYIDLITLYDKPVKL